MRRMLRLCLHLFRAVLFDSRAKNGKAEVPTWACLRALREKKSGLDEGAVVEAVALGTVPVAARENIKFGPEY